MARQVSHTPGPWFTQNNGYYWEIVVDRREHAPSFAYVLRNDFDARTAGQDREQANAHLIAAAPDLLEALTDCVRTLEDRGFSAGHPTVARARAALAKATGQEGR